MFSLRCCENRVPVGTARVEDVVGTPLPNLARTGDAVGDIRGNFKLAAVGEAKAVLEVESEDVAPAIAVGAFNRAGLTGAFGLITPLAS